MNADPAPRSNPFSTRFIRPGALDYIFPTGQSPAAESIESLVSRLNRNQWRGQIVGPHGSGKSTLLAALEPALGAAGRVCWTARLRDAQRAMPGGWARAAAQTHANQIVIDGFEQLSGWNRWRVRFCCRRRGWGLLVTAHRDMGLSGLFETTADMQTAHAIVDQLLVAEPVRLAPEVVTEHFHAAGGDVRETLFRLYDVWEGAARTRAGEHDRAE
jgi:hypothetical protein